MPWAGLFWPQWLPAPEKPRPAEGCWQEGIYEDGL